MIYVIRSKPGLYKIGFSRTSASVKTRLSSLRTGNHEVMELLLTAEGDIEHEQDLHKRLAKFRVRREWFSDDGWVDPFLTNVIGLLEAYDAPFVLSHTDEQIYNFCLLPIGPQGAVFELDWSGVPLKSGINPAKYKDVRYAVYA